MSSRLIAIAAGCALLGACMTPLPQAGSLDAGHGEVVKYNAAMQIIDPDPVYPAGGAQPGDHGEKAANATKRYRTDQVKETESGSQSGEDGGSSGGSSGPR
jgi:hypothetical protein